MGKKQISESSTKISKNEKRNLNSLIKILKPKVYITDASNFKKLVQDLTGNWDPIMPSYDYIPPSIPKPVSRQDINVPVVVDIGDDDDYHHGCHHHHAAKPYQERSFDSSVESSEASMLTSFSTTPAESPQQLCISDATFNVVLESGLPSYNKVDLPVYGDIESWLLDIDPYEYQVSSIPAYQRQVGDYNNYDFSELI